MSKHTPGPWAVGPDLEVFYAPNGAPITRPLRLTSLVGRTEEDVANAKLIAAAPELLAALEGLTEGPLSLNELNELMADAREVIAKAKGEKE